jgi:hypothetical protein
MRPLGLILGLALLAAGCIGDDPVASDFGPAQQPVECIGIPAQTCTEVVTDARRNADPGTIPVTIRAVCSRSFCTTRDGDAQIDIRYSNGRHDSFGIGWAAAVPGQVPAQPPTLAVDPVCQGVPPGPCRDAAEFDDGSGRTIRAIVVRCTAPEGCSETRGGGDVIASYEDGSTTTGSWSYEGAIP